MCFEGVEKLLHKFLHRHEAHEDEEAVVETLDEKTKIKGAIRTDFILSAEIIIIALGVVEKYDLMTRSLVMTAIGIGMTGFCVRFGRRYRQTRRLRYAADASKKHGHPNGRTGLDCLYALVHARFERGGYACHVPCRRRFDYPQLGFFA